MAHQTPAEVVDAALGIAASDPDATTRSTAALLQTSPKTVERYFSRFAPVRESLAQIKRDEFTAAWQQVAIKGIARMDALLDGDPEVLKTVPAKSSIGAEFRNYAVGSGIASEKALLFAGQPTQLVAHAHEVRVQLPEMLAKLVRVGSLPVGPPGLEDGAVSATAGANPAISAQPAGCVLPAATDEEVR